MIIKYGMIRIVYESRGINSLKITKINYEGSLPSFGTR